MGCESYLRKRRISVSRRHYKPLYLFEFESSGHFHLQIFRLRADISKATAHARIQHLYKSIGSVPFGKFLEELFENSFKFLELKRFFFRLLRDHY
jgi:hypothetical protein